ncbi:MAG TPA: molybdenum cofactor biosynthesis protein MoaE [Rhodanobacteraceae bacterium]|nr:molybdenum cofactor biosynthesis protein MoaE [Rhodanobacteraceae bacterium]
MSDSIWKLVDRSEAAIDPALALTFVSDPAFGGLCLFVGKVRESNLGKPVLGISYDVFAPLALNGFGQLVQQASAEFGPRIRVYLAHAHGRLAVGDVAVVVAVGTPHRDAAFKACRQIIEAVKHQSPIWKQEHYLDGDSEWSEGCSLCDTHTHDDAPH